MSLLTKSMPGFIWIVLASSPSLSPFISRSITHQTMIEEDSTMEGNGKGSTSKGGFRAAMFIYAMNGLEGMGFVANMAGFFLYFTMKMYFDLSTAANTLTNFMGTTFLLSIVGGFISDTYINRLHTCLIFGFLEILGLMMLTIQASKKSLQPNYCGPNKSSCIEGGPSIMFYCTLGLLALGAGGVRGSLTPLGADQFNQKDRKGAKSLATYFNWLLLSAVLGATIGVTVVVGVSTSHNYKNWKWGFLISLLATFVGFVALVMGTPFYKIQVPGDSPLLRIAQVIIVAIRNRRLSLPDNPKELYEIKDNEKDPIRYKLKHTNQLRWMDKAAIIQEGRTLENNLWTVCPVTQVEETKTVARMLPIVASTVIMNTCLAQLQTFSMSQGFLMYRTFSGKQLPVPSVPVIPLVFMIFLLPLYEFAFVPLARKITKIPTGITQLQRVGVGLVLSVISMAVAGAVEVERRNSFNNNMPPVQINVLWLGLQYGIFGIADMFTLVGLMEFFYRESPKGMTSLSTSFTWISLSCGYFLSSAFVDIINGMSGGGDKRKGWLYGENINENHLDYFYWFLAVLSFLNFLNYLYWSSWYKYKEEDSEMDFEREPKTEFLKASPVFMSAPDVDDDEQSRIDGLSIVAPTNADNVGVEKTLTVDVVAKENVDSDTLITTRPGEVAKENVDREDNHSIEAGREKESR